MLDVLVAGYRVDSAVARRLKEETGGSDFVFVAGRQVVTSTLPADTAQRLVDKPAGSKDDYLALATPLSDIRGETIGKLFILRSFEAARRSIAALRH